MSRLRVCIVTADIVGPVRNGGIGTAYYNLAHALARAGHDVTVLYALGSYCEQRSVSHWVREYRHHGIRFVPLPATNVQAHSAIKMSAGVYHWLKTRRFDIVHCHEWRGLGFYTAIGKRQGLCLDDTVLCIGAHSPVLWHLQGMNELADAEALEVDFMERESVARADVLWSPSAHMVDWMRREGWTLPDRVLVQQCILLDVKPRKGGGARPGAELVFFGRLETRKGLDLFCDALDRLMADGPVPTAVTFLGKPATVGEMSSDDYIKMRAARWAFPWRIVSDLDRDAAMDYLKGPDRVAVLPSRLDNLPYTVLECLGSRIPFVAAAVGGIPEMIRPDDRRTVLFALSADSLATRLASVLRRGLAPVRMRIPRARTLAGWLSWHRTIGKTVAPQTRPDVSHSGPPPLVSVCVTHRNRPAFLRAAIESIDAQDYPRLEVVLVDDGSDDPEALACLDALEPRFRTHGWQIVRQANRYLGAARNAAIAAARGDYLLFMDDDNLAMPHEISTFVGAMRRTGADVLTCFLDTFQSAAPNPVHQSRSIWPFLGGATAPGLLRNVFGDANAFFKRSVFERVGGFSEDFGLGCEDWELFARVVLHGLRLEVVPEALVRYRQSTQGMLQSTSPHANRMRALRPYFELLPPHLRPLVHLSQRDRGQVHAATAAVPLDHVRQAVVFGSGEAGRLALALASKCGWSVPYLVDNNPAMWNRTAHGRPVKRPASVTSRDVDLVIVASVAGKPSIAAQLVKMGLTSGEQFVHFLDPVKVAGMTYQVSLP